VTDLTGRTAIVTGTAHGIGAGIAAALEEAGAVVHGCDLDTVDVTDGRRVRAFVGSIGTVDILVNNAGGVVGQIGRPLEEVSEEDWRAVVDANLTSTFLCTRAVAPGMKERGYGRIVNISSGAGRSVSLTGIQAYASAKAGQIGFTRRRSPSGSRTARRGRPASSGRSPPAGSARPRTSPTACCSSPRRSRRG
jgi:3-oxoacyl-[acyl-carrier protein] reductase